MRNGRGFIGLIGLIGLMVALSWCLTTNGVSAMLHFAMSVAEKGLLHGAPTNGRRATDNLFSVPRTHRAVFSILIISFAVLSSSLLNARGDLLDTLQLRSPLPTPDAVQSVGFGNGRFIAADN